MLDSPLPDLAITALWQGATGLDHNLDRLGISGREWLRRVAQICATRLRGDDPAFAPDVPGAP